MNRIGAALAVIAITISVTLIAARLLRRDTASQASVRSVPAAANQASPAPVPQSRPVKGAIMIGNGTAFTVIRAEPQPDDFSYLHISLSGQGELLLEDNQSRLTGFDAKSGKLLNQIENSSYDEGDQIDDDDDESPASGAAAPAPTPEPTSSSGLPDTDFRRLEMSRPTPGIYLLRVTVDANSRDPRYSLDLSFTNPARNLSYGEFKDVAAAPGSIHTYRLEIPAEAEKDIRIERVPQ